ncbi:hypothetical protein B0H34DRAFT_846084 [Crassisporium funariophilum]|nr:hypothetical protein B0H34DRAFT_846084 [Crassisporium funariophilum]
MVHAFPLVSLLFQLAIYGGTANAWFRVACTGPLVQERVDPIISPGSYPSNHVHTIHGGSNFAPNSTFDTLRASKCTSCLVPQDMSNYWFPKLYFQDPQTKLFEPVPNGGLLVYYQNRGDGDKRNGGPGLKAFPPGFKMISGNPRSRSKKFAVGEGSQGELRERAVHWACLRYPSSAGYESDGFPTTDCESGLNARVHMPACWDGKNVDSPDHMAHVAYLSGLDNGKCPSTHPVPLMKLFYEITWNVHDFASRWNPAVNKWPFVYATGDPTGYSWHADFQNGWDTNALQNAIDQCDNPNDETGSGKTEACRFLTVLPVAQADQCRTPAIVKETIDGKLAKLPGCNPIQSGPGDATMYSDSNCPK